MKKLDPKAVWMFFLQYLSIFVVLGFFVLPAIFSPITFIIFALVAESESIIAMFIIGIFLAIIWMLGPIVLSFLWSRLVYKNWEYQVANDALRIKKGVIWKKEISIPYERVQNVDIFRGIVSRMLGLSDVNVQTAGYTGGSVAGFRAEGRIPGLNPQVASKLRDELIRRAKGKKQGL